MAAPEAAASQQRPQPAAGWVQFIRSATHSLQAPINGILPPCFTARQCINLHKLLVLPLYLFFLHAYGDSAPFDFGKSFGPAAVALLVCHSL